MMNGVINIYKERGFTSHDVVAKLRGILHQRKIGHTGTLDPEATGVLPVCLGRATKLCDLLTDKCKTYEVTFLLGKTTDTQDIWGTCLTEHEVSVTEVEVRTCVASFLGEQLQVPPMYSALKVNGKKLYELAREGKEVERKARKVTFYEIKILRMDLPYVTMRVHCSKGTYIRTLCHDIGQQLGCGACMTALTRTQVERFLLEDSLTLAQVEQAVAEETIQEHLVKIDSMFGHLEEVHMLPKFDLLVHNGNRFLISHIENNEICSYKNEENVRVYDSDEIFVGVFSYCEKGAYFAPVKMFLEA